MRKRVMIGVFHLAGIFLFIVSIFIFYFAIEAAVRNEINHSKIGE